MDISTCSAVVDAVDAGAVISAVVIPVDVFTASIAKTAGAVSVAVAVFTTSIAETAGCVSVANAVDISFVSDALAAVVAF